MRKRPCYLRRTRKDHALTERQRMKAADHHQSALNHIRREFCPLLGRESRQPNENYAVVGQLPAEDEFSEVLVRRNQELHQGPGSLPELSRHRCPDPVRRHICTRCPAFADCGDNPSVHTLVRQKVQGLFGLPDENGVRPQGFSGKSDGGAYRWFSQSGMGQEDLVNRLARGELIQDEFDQ